MVKNISPTLVGVLKSNQINKNKIPLLQLAEGKWTVKLEITFRL